MDKQSRIDHYEIKEQLGVGTTSTVYKAWDTVLKRFVALKIIHPPLADKENFLNRFYLEAQAIASIENPEIVKIYNINISETNSYIVEEYIEGQSLDKFINNNGIYPEELAFYIILKVANGLKEAHNKGIIHRDLKPENIIITDKGKIKIIDFGLAHIEGVERITQPGALLGSIPYISPEQLKGEKVEKNSDIFSLGIILYELITGKHPFSNKKDVAVIINEILNSEPLAPSKHTDYINPVGEKIVLKCIEKEKEYRYTSVDELITDITEFLNLSTVDWETASANNIKGRIPLKRNDKKKLIRSLITQWSTSNNKLDKQQYLNKIKKLGGKIPKYHFIINDFKKISVTLLLTLFFILIIVLIPKETNQYKFLKLPNKIIKKVKKTTIKKNLTKRKNKLSKTTIKKNKKKEDGSTKTIKEKISSGTLKILTFPWAQIYIDNKYIGKTPFINAVTLPTGTHTLLLKNPYTETVTETINIITKLPTEKRYRLKFLPSKIKITDISGDIWINGVKLDKKKYNKWIKVPRTVKFRIKNEKGEKECIIKLLPGESKQVSCSQ